MSTPLLSLHGIHRRFPSPSGNIPVLCGLDLNLDPGERLLVLGPSGCGKTTLLHLMALLDRPDDGEILWRGESIAAWDDVRRSAFRAREIGMVFQQFHALPHRSVRDNLRLRRRYHPDSRPDLERENSLLDEIGLLSRADHPARLLSGGEVQRLCIARALLLRPALLLADEPTGNLDEQNAARVRDLFARIAGPDTAVIIATHDPRWQSFTPRTLSLAQLPKARPSQGPVAALPSPHSRPLRNVPLRSLTLFLSCFAAALLLGVALRFMQSATRNTRDLLQAWPEATCTLHFATPPHPSDLQRILNILPPASAFGHRMDKRVALVDGFPAPDHFQGRGSGFSAEDLADGTRVALLSIPYAQNQALLPGDTFVHKEQVFRVLGVGHLIPDADVLLPARAFDGPMPDTWRVSLPAAKLESLLLAPEWEDIALTLTDHDLRRSEIRSAFDRLRLSLQALGTVIALLTALVIHSLLSADVRERRSEIGLRRSLGARPRDIRNLFLGEAAALGVPAAILGLFPWLVLLPPDRVFSAFALLVLWILGNAAVPALRAAALPPSEALRGA